MLIETRVQGRSDPSSPKKNGRHQPTMGAKQRRSNLGIMRFATTVMSLSTLLSPSNMGSINIARAETIVPGARSLTIDECLRLVDTETATEFG